MKKKHRSTGDRPASRSAWKNLDARRLEGIGQPKSMHGYQSQKNVLIKLGFKLKCALARVIVWAKSYGHAREREERPKGATERAGRAACRLKGIKNVFTLAQSK